jgi:uncharacterized protein
MTILQGVLPESLVWMSPDPYTLPFWEAAAEHRLIVPRCLACGTYRMPPSPYCWRCRSREFELVDHDGAATLYSFTVIRHGVIPEIREALPIIAGVADLDGTNIDGKGSARLVASVTDVDPTTVHIGQRVQVDWYDVREGVAIPILRPT